MQRSDATADARSNARSNASAVRDLAVHHLLGRIRLLRRVRLLRRARRRASEDARVSVSETDAREKSLRFDVDADADATETGVGVAGGRGGARTRTRAQICRQGIQGERDVEVRLSVENEGRDGI